MMPMPDLSIVCISDRPNSLRLLIACLRLQTSPAWELLVLDQTERAACLAPVTEAEAIGETRISWYAVPRIGDVGASMKMAYTRLAKGEFVAVPNDDAYYVPGFVDRVIWTARAQNLDLVYFDWIFDRANNTGPYRHMTGKPQFGHVDVGGFIVKRDLLISDGWTDRDEGGDGRLVERLCKTCRHGVVADQRIMYVKN